MIIVMFSIVIVALAVSIILIAVSIKHLSDEINELKDSFEFHKKIHKYERPMVEQKIKEFIQLLNQLEKSINKEENENQD